MPESGKVDEIKGRLEEAAGALKAVRSRTIRRIAMNDSYT